mmetsp:Transcript_5148/g.5921  ORF Transcript_5148/g.5921 Transcript_5148/m.5921 type:complete len:117 (+) Transcript_5148:768-1118(+)
MISIVLNQFLCVHCFRYSLLLLCRRCCWAILNKKRKERKDENIERMSKTRTRQDKKERASRERIFYRIRDPLVFFQKKIVCVFVFVTPNRDPDQDGHDKKAPRSRSRLCAHTVVLS